MDRFMVEQESILARMPNFAFLDYSDNRNIFIDFSLHCLPFKVSLYI
jgi:hypothetical protein